MAFVGVATITQINDRLVRITGVTLAADSAGTIGLFGFVGPVDITLPAAFHVSAFSYAGNPVSLQDAIAVRITLISANAVSNLEPSVLKSGTTVADFLVSVNNTDLALGTQSLEIEISFRGPRVGEPAVIA